MYSGNHTLKECKTPKAEYKCINCLVYNKHHKDHQIDIAHSALHKECPSLIAVLEKYRKNTAY